MGMPCKKFLFVQTTMSGRKNLLLDFRGRLLIISKSQLIKLLLVLLMFNHEKGSIWPKKEKNIPEPVCYESRILQQLKDVGMLTSTYLMKLLQLFFLYLILE
jgi:hypothetical protein